MSEEKVLRERILALQRELDYMKGHAKRELDSMKGHAKSRLAAISGLPAPADAVLTVRVRTEKGITTVLHLFEDQVPTGFWLDTEVHMHHVGIRKSMKFSDQPPDEQLYRVFVRDTDSECADVWSFALKLGVSNWDLRDNLPAVFGAHGLVWTYGIRSLLDDPEEIAPELWQSICRSLEALGITFVSVEGAFEIEESDMTCETDTWSFPHSMEVEEKRAGTLIHVPLPRAFMKGGGPLRTIKAVLCQTRDKRFWYGLLRGDGISMSHRLYMLWPLIDCGGTWSCIGCWEKDQVADGSADVAVSLIMDAGAYGGENK